MLPNSPTLWKVQRLHISWLLLAFVFFAACTPLVAQPVCSQFPCAVQSFNGSASAVGAGDLNGDGAPDFAATRSNGTVGVFINDGLGDFQNVLNYAMQPTPNSVIVGDVDNDGDNDVLCTHSTNGVMSVLRNNGDGTMSPAAYAPCGQTPVYLALGDLNNDGDVDGVVVNFINSGTLSIMTNLGDGTFTKTATLPVGRQPTRVVTGDFNSDDALDLAVIYRSVSGLVGYVGLYFNNGNGTFGSQVIALESESVPQAVELGDLNLDGNDDLVVVTEFGPSVYRLMGDGTGGFKVFSHYSTSGGSSVTALVDLNDDLRPDLLTRSANASQTLPMKVRYAQPDGSFGPISFVWSTDLPLILALGDFDMDDDPDALVATVSGYTVLRNDGGTLIGYQMINEDSSATLLEAADIDHDGESDLVGCTTSGSLFVLKNQGRLEFLKQTFDLVGGFPTAMTLAHLNLDQELDVVVRNNTDKLFVWLNAGGGTYSSPAQLTVGSGAGRIATGDLDSDGDVDLAVPVSNGLNMLHNNGSGQFPSSTILPLSYTPNAVVAGDLNVDGKADLVTTSNIGGPAVRVLLQQSTGQFTTLAPLTLIGTTNSRLQLFDMDGDGDLDAVAPTSSPAQIGIALNDGSGVLLPATYVPTISTERVRIGDVNGDERPDFVTTLAATFGSVVEVLVDHGGDGFVGTRHTTLQNNTDVAVSDFDGNGTVDIAICFSSSNKTLISRNEGLLASIATQPQSQSVETGDDVTLNASVSSSEPVKYQWTKDDSNLSETSTIFGVHTDTLQILGASQFDAGEYRLQISDGACDMWSVGATLTVAAPCPFNIVPHEGPGVVDVDDLLALINSWGPCNGCAADVLPAGGNGVVDVDDLLGLINTWGPCP